MGHGLAQEVGELAREEARAATLGAGAHRRREAAARARAVRGAEEAQQEEGRPFHPGAHGRASGRAPFRVSPAGSGPRGAGGAGPALAAPRRAPGEPSTKTRQSTQELNVIAARRVQLASTKRGAG